MKRTRGSGGGLVRAQKFSEGAEKLEERQGEKAFRDGPCKQRTPKSD